MLETDFLVVGGGVVGLATAYQIMKKHPGRHVVVLEKEPKVAKHQSGRNSGVIHSGIYYKPGSSKAINCRQGKLALERFCYENYIPFQKIGKLIVATDQEEEGRLHDILQRGKENGVKCKLLTKEEMLKIEPNAAGICAIHVPETGIVNYRTVCNCLSTMIKGMGGNVYCGERITSIEYNSGVLAETSNGMLFHCKMLINCGGLYADRIARLAGHEPIVKIIPFRGEYYTLSPEAIPLVKGLIYPVPDPQFPFLGVHFTKMIGGGVECGPNAVLAFGRECYKKHQISIPELWETLTFPGFRKLAIKYWKTGIHEALRSISKKLYTQSLKRLVPAVESGHLIDNRPAGIRAQAVRTDGTLVDDFLIERQDDIIHVLNTPSPAATACLTIGEQIAREVE